MLAELVELVDVKVEALDVVVVDEVDSVVVVVGGSRVEDDVPYGAAELLEVNVDDVLLKSDVVSISVLGVVVVDVVVDVERVVVVVLSRLVSK